MGERERGVGIDVRRRGVWMQGGGKACKGAKRECLEGNGLVGSGGFCCGELVGEFREENTGSVFCWITHLVLLI